MKKKKQKRRGIQKLVFLFLAALLLTLQGFAQNGVTGRVTSEDGEPVPGATVVVKGTTRGTVTGPDGSFSINAENGDVLVISFVGMKSKEITYSGQSSIEIQLEPDVIGLEEVVAVGYGTMRKSDLTGAAVSADIEAFREAPNVNILQSLQGAVPGVSVGAVNQAGEEPSIEIRGQSTLGGNKNILIVVDGIIFKGSLTELNPSDIKSVDILKDASSKAIYGAQAANGVILVTTKSGKALRKPLVTYSGSVSSQSPSVNARPLNREETLQKIKDINYEIAYLAPDYINPNPDWDYNNHSELLQPLLDGIENGTDYDWWDALTSPGHIHNHLLSISGGTENTTYYLSGGYTDQEGFIKNDEYQRTTLRINIDTDINSWLTIGTNTFGSFSDYSGEYPSMFGLIRSTSPLVKPTDEEGNYVIYPFGDNQQNPFLDVLADNMDKRNRISALIYGNIDIPFIEGLSYRINYNNNLSWTTDATSSKYGANILGSASKIHTSGRDVMLDNILTYDRPFGNHKIKATIVSGYNKTEFDRTNAAGSNIPNLSLSYNSLEQAIIQEISSSAWEQTAIYQMGRLSYNYKNKYLLNATLRRDGFSGFAKNNKFAIFPSIGAGWIMTEEDFFNSEKINYLKLRASYGRNGNLTPRYTSLARISAGEDSKYVFGDGASTSLGQSVASLANNDLTWELTTGLNVGLDFNIIDNRISGNLEYYNSTTKDLLWDMILPRMSGFQEIKTNIGEISNSGFEFSINISPIQTSDFSWNIGMNFSTNKNEIISLLGEDKDNDGIEDDLEASGLFIGESIGTIYDYEVAGIWQLGDEVPVGYSIGNYKIIDQQANESNEYEIAAGDDRVILGRTEPAYRFSIQNTLNYKNFTLRFFINSIQGGKDGYMARNHPDGARVGLGTSQNSNWLNFYDYWSPSNTDAKYAALWYENKINAVRYIQRNFIRLQDISLAYNLNSPMLNSIGLSNAKIYVSGKNLLTLTEWDGWDPETGQGIEINDAFPLMKSYTFGVEISF